jgi:DnaJ-class molecular chaperone
MEKVHFNEGDYGKGNLYIFIHPKEHKYYKIINDYDLVFNYSLTIEELLEMRQIAAAAENAHHCIYMYPSDKIKLDAREKWYLLCDIYRVTKKTNIVKVSEKGLWDPNRNIRGNLFIEFDLQWQLGSDGGDNDDNDGNKFAAMEKIFEFSATRRSGDDDAADVGEMWNICDYLENY